jgi:hypothetical protein
MRADASKIFHRVRQRDGHALKAAGRCGCFAQRDSQDFYTTVGAAGVPRYEYGKYDCWWANRDGWRFSRQRKTYLKGAPFMVR